MACFICGNENASLCQYCSLNIACGAHYHLHRNHQLCYPVRIEQKPFIGRCLVATKDIEPGSLILEDWSASSGPKVRTNFYVKSKWRKITFNTKYSQNWYFCYFSSIWSSFQNEDCCIRCYTLKPDAFVQKCPKCQFNVCKNCISKDHGCTYLQNCQEKVWAHDYFLSNAFLFEVVYLFDG